MKSMKALLGLVMIFFVVAGSMAVSAQSSSTATGTIEVNSDGEFRAWLCNSGNFYASTNPNVNPVVTSASGAVARGYVSICYVDTHAWRHGFTATLQATDFHATNPGVNATIPVANLYAQRMVRVRNASNIINTNPDAGLIYAVSDIPAQKIGPHTTNNGSAATFTPMTVTLGSPVLVNVGNEGVGITDTTSTTNLMSSLYMDLVIPAGQRPATYQTTYTLTLVMDQP